MGSRQAVIPGMRICAAEDHYQPGLGTYILHGYIYASLVGRLRLVSSKGEKSQSNGQGGSEMITVEVEAPGGGGGGTLQQLSSSEDVLGGLSAGTGSDRGALLVPKIGDVVTCRVLSVNPRHAKLQILCVRQTVLKDAFRCQLRKEDVRAHDKDRVEMYKCFRPTDIVLARVLSYGEANSGYLVTTAENEFGVVIARSELSGEKMVPISWTEMQCPKTFNKEQRKIAKVVPEDGGGTSESKS